MKERPLYSRWGGESAEKHFAWWCHLTMITWTTCK